MLLAGSGSGRDAWVSDEADREAGVRTIRQMLVKDRAAVTAIHQALAVAN